MNLALADVYRALLLVEILVVMACYLWALWRTARSLRSIENEVLRDVRAGVCWRHAGVLLLTLIFAVAVSLSFGERGAGRIVFNLWLQAALVCLVVAWGKVDRRRFRHVEDPGRAKAAATALQRLETSEHRRRDNAARWRKDRERGR